MWVKVSNWSNSAYLFDYTSSDGANDYGLNFLVNLSDGNWKYRVYADTNSQLTDANTLTINNQWHNIVFTRDESGNPGGGGIVKLYVDGVLSFANYATPTGALASPGNVIFGRNQFLAGAVDGVANLEGEFGPIRVFAHELTQSEIEYEYDMFALRYKPDSFTATPANASN